MSEHPRYQRDRSTSRDNVDRTDSERRHHEPRAVIDHDHNLSHDDDISQRRYSDHGSPHHSSTHYKDPQSFQRDRDSRGFSHNYSEHSDRSYASRQNATIRYEQPRTVAPPEQDVWLREKQSRITFNDSDLQDIEFIERSDRVRKLATYGGVVAMIGLIVFLGFSSTPDLSPLEIIAADGYEGEQPTKTPFNLASLHDCEPGAECAKALESKVIPVVAKTTTVIEPVTKTSTTIATQTSPAKVAETFISKGDAPLADNLAGNLEILEIAAADTGLASTRVSSTNSESGLYDRLTVLQQWSNVRGTPDINGDILVSLDIGKTVTKLGETGQWIEVQVDERPSVTGYMHRSTIAAQ